MSYVARRFRRRLTVIAAGVAAAAGLGVPAAAQASTAHIATTGATGAQAQATTTGYTPGSTEWWLSEWDVPAEVWPLTEGSGVTVGVVDSGVQADLPDLSGAVLRGGDVLNRPGNGEIDYGSGHGTTVAALIAGQGVGPVDLVGIAPRAKVLPVHVLGPENIGNSHIAAGIEYAVHHGAKVINVSLGGPAQSATSCDPELQDAVSDALAHNVVVVAASGDTNLGGTGPEEPATCDGVLAVGGIEQNGTRWQYSTQGPNVSVAAPADHILSLTSAGGSGTGSGTSFASPLIAGEAALIRSKYPSMPWYQVDQRIIGTAIRINGLKTPNDSYGYGIANVAKAVDASKYPVSSSSPNPPYTRYLAWLKTSDGQAWAKQNGVTVPSSGSSQAAAEPGGAPTPAATSSSGSSTLIIILVIVIVVVAAIVIALVARSRKRSRPGAYPPGPPGTYPPGGQNPPGAPGFSPPGGQYPPPSPGPYPPGSGSYPPPGSGSYPPGGDQQQR